MEFHGGDKVEVISSRGVQNNIDILSLSYTRHAEDVRHGMICIGQKHFQKALELLHNTVVAALASDPNVWNAVWENKALQELLQSQNANKEYVADNDSVGDTDSQDAAVSSKKLTELSDDENETGNSQTGLMDVINNFSTSLPKYTSSAAQRSLKTLCQAVKKGDTIFVGQYLFTGNETTSVWLEASSFIAACHVTYFSCQVAEVNGEYVVCLVISSRGVQNNIDILSLSYTRHAEDVRHGMICIGQKHFQKALELLHNVVTAPMSSINAIAVEAFKKYILVSLIQNR
ncbi:hypothetical protein D5086_021636, partial [Populus alba]